MSLANILLVDNDPETIRITSEFLKQENYSIISALSANDARYILEREKVDLAIVDIRLAKDEDEKDFSGLALARETAITVPKIILTRFPTYQAVREALGSTIDNLPPAVGFVAKQEGLEALLRHVRLALLSLNPLLETRLLQEFKATAMLSLPARISEVGPDEASRRLQQSFEAAAIEITKYREQENRRAAQYHIAGLIASSLGMALILGSVATIWLNYIDATILPLIVSALVEAVGALFFIREDSAYKRVNSYFIQLNELNSVGNLLSICDTLENQLDRELYKRKIIDQILEKWLN